MAVKALTNKQTTYNQPVNKMKHKLTPNILLIILLINLCRVHVPTKNTTHLFTSINSGQLISQYVILFSC